MINQGSDAPGIGLLAVSILFSELSILWHGTEWVWDNLGHISATLGIIGGVMCIRYWKKKNRMLDKYNEALLKSTTKPPITTTDE